MLSRVLNDAPFGIIRRDHHARAGACLRSMHQLTQIVWLLHRRECLWLTIPTSTVVDRRVFGKFWLELLTICIYFQQIRSAATAERGFAKRERRQVGSHAASQHERVVVGKTYLGLRVGESVGAPCVVPPLGRVAAMPYFSSTHTRSTGSWLERHGCVQEDCMS